VHLRKIKNANTVNGKYWKVSSNWETSKDKYKCNKIHYTKIKNWIAAMDDKLIALFKHVEFNNK